MIASWAKERCQKVVEDRDIEMAQDFMSTCWGGRWESHRWCVVCFDTCLDGVVLAVIGTIKKNKFSVKDNKFKLWEVY